MGQMRVNFLWLEDHVIMLGVNEKASGVQYQCEQEGCFSL